MPVSIVVRSRAVFRYCLCLVRFISSLCVVQLFLHCFRPPRVCMCVCVFAGCGANMWPLAAALATDRGLECVQTISDWMYFILHTKFSWFFVNEFSIMRPPSPSQINFSEQHTHTHSIPAKWRDEKVKVCWKYETHDSWFQEHIRSVIMCRMIVPTTFVHSSSIDSSAALWRASAIHRRMWAFFVVVHFLRHHCHQQHSTLCYNMPCHARCPVAMVVFSTPKSKKTCSHMLFGENIW